MKQQRIMLVLLLLCLGLTGCTAGHSGTTVIAFLRDGQLWTIDPDGANAFETVGQQTAIVSSAWSPDHRLLTFRTLDVDFAKTEAAKHIVSPSASGVIGDLPSTLNTVGVDGGTPIEIAFSNPETAYSNPQWNNDGSRLIYRETPKNFAANPSNALWWIAQNDQPGGIATKPFAGTFSIPSISYNSQDYLIVGNATADVFTTNMAGGNKISRGAPLINHPLPASLERMLWRPGHQNQSFVYINTQPTTNNNIPSTKGQLVLRTLAGSQTTLATCTCTQFAWSPDGNSLLYNTGTTDTILNLENHSSFTFSVETGAVPYWSPDSQFLLLDGPHNLSLVSPANKQQTRLLTDNQADKAAQPASLPTTTALLQPVTNNLWSADSRHFVFLNHQRLNWQGSKLSSSNNLYTASINAQGQTQATPTSIATGHITQAGWTYEDPNTSFLY
jgi:Tol biopolymer transport system component